MTSVNTVFQTELLINGNGINSLKK